MDETIHVEPGQEVEIIADEPAEITEAPAEVAPVESTPEATPVEAPAEAPVEENHVEPQ